MGKFMDAYVEFKAIGDDDILNAIKAIVEASKGLEKPIKPRIDKSPVDQMGKVVKELNTGFVTMGNSAEAGFKRASRAAKDAVVSAKEYVNTLLSVPKAASNPYSVSGGGSVVGRGNARDYMDTPGKPRPNPYATSGGGSVVGDGNARDYMDTPGKPRPNPYATSGGGSVVGHGNARDYFGSPGKQSLVDYIRSQSQGAAGRGRGSRGADDSFAYTGGASTVNVGGAADLFGASAIGNSPEEQKIRKAIAAQMKARQSAVKKINEALTGGGGGGSGGGGGGGGDGQSNWDLYGHGTTPRRTMSGFAQWGLGKMFGEAFASSEVGNALSGTFGLVMGGVGLQLGYTVASAITGAVGAGLESRTPHAGLVAGVKNKGDSKEWGDVSQQSQIRYSGLGLQDEASKASKVLVNAGIKPGMGREILNRALAMQYSDAGGNATEAVSDIANIHWLRSQKAAAHLVSSSSAIQHELLEDPKAGFGFLKNSSSRDIQEAMAAAFSSGAAPPELAGQAFLRAANRPEVADTVSAAMDELIPRVTQQGYRASQAAFGPPGSVHNALGTSYYSDDVGYNTGYKVPWGNEEPRIANPQYGSTSLAGLAEKMQMEAAQQDWSRQTADNTEELVKQITEINQKTPGKDDKNKIDPWGRAR